MKWPGLLVAIVFGVFALKFALAALPDAFIREVFCALPARGAALYWNAPFAADSLTFWAKGVALQVTRACAGTDFFSLAWAFLAAGALFTRWSPARCLLWACGALPSAWCVTLLANTLRLILLVPVERLFPKEQVPAAHLACGVFVFLPVLMGLWYTVLRLRPDGVRNEATDHQRGE